MELLENQIEDIIYTSPWILDDNYIIAQIAGSRGQNGRQVNPVKRGGKFIDLLFKDTRDNRPVVIELKKSTLTRESLGQILEYKSLLFSLDDEEKELWINEFGRYYYCPKLILIGSEIEESIQIAATLAGIDVRIFTTEISHIGLSSFESIIEKQEQWNRFRNCGIRAVHERKDWINNLLDQINEFLQDFHEKVRTIKKVPQPAITKTYFPQGNPFINIPFYNGDDEYIAGFYEFYDASLPFDDEYIYCEFNFVNDDIEAKLLKNLKKQVVEFCTLNNLEYCEVGPNLMPILKVKREVFENSRALNQLLSRFLEKALVIYNDCYNTETLQV